MEFWKGRLVRLRAVEPADWEKFAEWNKDEDATRLCQSIQLPVSSVLLRRQQEQGASDHQDSDAFHFAIENAEGELVGDLQTHSCSRRNGTFEYGIAIGREHWRKGYANEAVMLVLKYYFEEMRYQKATVTIFDYNSGSRLLHEKLGFQLEGRMRRMRYTKGQFHDKLFYGLTAEEFAARQLS